MKKDREKKQKYSNITDATIMGSTSEESALYASANKEHLAILDDKTLGRTLEGISKYKVNPKYQYQNINQQAGYSAEIKEQAHANAHNILMKNGERLVQYDNLSSRQKAQIKKFSQTMPRLIKIMSSWIMLGWIEIGMLLLTRSRRVNLWVKTARSVLKNSHPKVMRNILKMA
ncbi:hypothetical protein HpMMM19_06860 [Helicobacter pylori]